MPMSSPATDGRILLSLMEHPSPSCRYPPGSRRLRMRNPDLLECEHAISRGAPGAASSDLHLIEHRWVAVAIVDRGVVTGRRHGGSRAVGKQRTSDATRFMFYDLPYAHWSDSERNITDYHGATTPAARTIGATASRAAGRNALSPRRHPGSIRGSGSMATTCTTCAASVVNGMVLHG